MIDHVLVKILKYVCLEKIFGVSMSDENKRKINYCPYCGAKVNPSFKYCPNCGASLSDVERTTTTIDRTIESVDISEDMHKLTVHRKRKPISSRPFSIVALVLWVLYMIIVLVDLPTAFNAFMACNDAISSVISTLRLANNIAEAVFIKITDIENTINALRMIQIGNVVYIFTEILSVVAVFFVLYYIIVDNAKEFKNSVITLFVLQLVGGVVAGFLSGYGVGYLESYLSILPQSIKNMIVKYIDRVSLIHRTMESMSWNIIASVAITVIAIVFSYLAYKEMKN